MRLIDKIKIVDEIKIGDSITIKMDSEEREPESQRISSLRSQNFADQDQVIEPDFTFTLTKADIDKLWQMSVSEGKKWAMRKFDIEDEVAALMVHTVAVGLDRNFKDLGLVIDYKLEFSV